MRYRLTLAVVAAFVGGSSIAAHAQAPAVVIPGAGVPGTGISNGPRGGRPLAPPALAPEGGRQATAPRPAAFHGSGDWRYLGYDPSWDRRS